LKDYQFADDVKGVVVTEDFYSSTKIIQTFLSGSATIHTGWIQSKGHKHKSLSAHTLMTSSLYLTPRLESLRKVQ
jgi:hypothetical protein